MIDDAVSGILLDASGGVNRQRARMNNNSVTASLIRITATLFLSGRSLGTS